MSASETIGEHLAEFVLTNLVNSGIVIGNLRAQGHNGTANM